MRCSKDALTSKADIMDNIEIIVNSVQSNSEDQENLTQNVSNEETSERHHDEANCQQVLKYSDMQFKFEDWKGPNMKGWEAVFGEDVDPPSLVIFSYCVFEAQVVLEFVVLYTLLKTLSGRRRIGTQDTHSIKTSLVR